MVIVMPTPFFKILEKKHRVPLMTSFISQEAQELQLLVALGDKVTYRKKIEEYKEEGRSFRLTKGQVYETHYETDEQGLFKNTIDVHVAVQVKGHSLTWYFWTKAEHMDQYPQEFRDELYDAAALAHKEVQNGCDMYYRGSNAVHIKLMHHDESESNRNHNHYRLKDNKSYTPEDFNQHMQALANSKIHLKFFAEGEIEKLCNKFAEYYVEWTKKEEGSLSLEESYFSDPKQLLKFADIVELQLFGGMQEPCRLNIDELQVDYNEARKTIEKLVNESVENHEERNKKLEELIRKMYQEYQELLKHRQDFGSRGLNSAIASSRQVDGSKNSVVKANMGMDDSRGKEDVAMPAWAVRTKKAKEQGVMNLLQRALTRLSGLDNKESSEYALQVLAELPQKPETVEAALEIIEHVQQQKNVNVHVNNVPSTSGIVLSQVPGTLLGTLGQINKKQQLLKSEASTTVGAELYTPM